MKKIYGLSTIMFALFFATNLQAQVYVNQAATGANNGTSWADAYADLSDALSSSSLNDEIWVAAGTYKPGGATPSVDAFFQPPHDVALYGGFAGTETNLSERDWMTNETILSGDHNGDDVDDDFVTNKTDNSLHVMWLTDTITNATVIDGFIIRNGITQDGTGMGDDRRGGGILSYGAPIVRNCWFTQNYGWFGGGFYPRGAAQGVTVEDCLFENNAGGFGAGMYNLAGMSTITNCTFTGNNVDERGGAIFHNGTNGTYTNCTFSDGMAGVVGGGITLVGVGTAVTMTDCTFSGLSSTFGGAVATFDQTFELVMDNCEFTMNTAATSGGALINTFAAKSIITNGTFSNNEARFGGAIYSQNDSSVVDISGSTFSSNNALDVGGAINIGGDGVVGTTTPRPLLSLTDVYILSNVAADQAGGVNIGNSNANFTNVIFDTNITTEMAGIGGGVSVNTNDSITADINFLNCLVVNNAASIGAGLSSWTGGDSAISTVILQNTILYNPAGNNYELEAGNPILASNGGNLSTDDSAVSGLVGTNDLNDTDPLFVDFDYEDYHLQNESPCVDQGIATGAPLFDIEGLPRVDDIDMGPYENQKMVGVLNLNPAFGQLAIYPNPVVENTLHYTFESTWRGEIQISITDMEGKNIMTQIIKKDDKKMTDVVDVKNLPQGMYNFTISNGRLVNTQNFVK